ncbi:MAG: hypothetical protein COV91_00265 [Candidatus Taylorbacteria bacterium CG11_big_fil_rev_8_21_14_0_20_46_11]|uniref:Ribosomal subunit interface protein n=1 Tax=Candidatus Taylorbacteria bacterium CG11_big_fil_rev_8_21_14_0_20_46_11 TaxID=1975025 RepID=A0A2H0KD63_9BACT|nr:MAG: hypothetical protein COV91_00265 [Candidatus Taylorbacteria bacterium CG11_big_fil_rev_8_21_14_0_20_46_11]
MRLTLKATQVTITDDIRDYLDKRLQSLNKIMDLEDPAVITSVELGRSTKHHQSGDIFYAEITVYRGKHSWRSVTHEATLTAAIDAMREEIANELSQRKGKRFSLLRKGNLAAKALLRGGYEGLTYLGRPAKAGWKYLRRMAGRKE